MPILLYDGVCGFCDRTVQFLLARDRRGVIQFAPLQGDYAQGVFARHPEVRHVDSLMLVEIDEATGRERVSLRSEGALRVAFHLGGVWRAAALLRIFPRIIRDTAYDGFAKVRYRVFGRRDTCSLPAEEHRCRFIP